MTTRQPAWARRVLLVDALHRAGPAGLTIRALLRGSGRAKATLYRDMAALRAFGLPLEVGVINGEARHSIAGTPDAVQTALGRVASGGRGPLARLLSLAAGPQLAPQVARADRPVLARPPVIRAIDLAFEEGRQLRLVYRPERLAGRSATYVVDPVFLRLVSHDAYLVACKEPDGAARTFKIARIERAIVTATRWKPHPDVTPRMFAHSTKAWSGEGVDVSVRIAPEGAPFAREYLLAPTQNFFEQPDGSVIVRARVAGIKEAALYVLSWGGKAEAISPPELRVLVRAQFLAGSRIHEAAEVSHTESETPRGVLPLS